MTPLTMQSPATAYALPLLEQALLDWNGQITGVARQFEVSAAAVDELLGLTSALVQRVDEDCAGLVGRTARNIGAAASSFLAERADSLAALSTLSGTGLTMLDNLTALSREQRAIARQADALGILAAMEVARLDAAGAEFGFMARELDEFSRMVGQGSNEVVRQIDEKRDGLVSMRYSVQRALQSIAEQKKAADVELRHTIDQTDRAVVDLAGITAGFRRCVSELSENISRVVAAVQMQDITRQQTEHVRDALKDTMAGDCSPATAPRRAAILKIQILQMQIIHASVAGWIAQIDDCLQAIYRLSSSDLVGVATAVLEQERILNAQSASMGSIEQAFSTDNEEMSRCLEGLHQLSLMVREYLDRSLAARGRMELLNFNSMIEARRLGSRAATLLEVAINISRISQEWGALTDRSGRAVEEMLRTFSGAQDENRIAVQASLTRLSETRHEVAEAMATLKDTAAKAGSTNSGVGAAVARLHGTIDAAGELVSGLRLSLDLIGRAKQFAEQALEDATMDGGSAELVDLNTLEDECAAAYTCEVERQVLRAALHGEPMPEAAANAPANDVELF